MNSCGKLLESYEKKKNEIKKRLDDFTIFGKRPDEDIFAELCFCLCTPQSRAKACDAFIKKIKVNGLLFNGSAQDIRRHMLGVRFCDNKARYIIEARNFFTDKGEIRIKNMINPNIREAREWLVKNVKGLGMKESSHFLRNIGMGSDLAILDRHILKNLKVHCVINEIPECLTSKRYLEIESKMRDFSRKIGIPLAELDLLFWSEETGEIFR